MSMRVFSALLLCSFMALPVGANEESQKIDRHAWVTRHNVVLTEPDFKGPLSVGNGEFAFTADITGLQTFEREYQKGIPFSTMSQWGFHTMPNPHGYTLEKFPRTIIETRGKPTPYIYYQEGKCPKEWKDAADYLYNNPSRLHLGRFAFVLKHKDGTPGKLSDLTDVHQELNLWTGRIESRFKFDGQPVVVKTCCHPELDQLAVHITSPLLAAGQLAVEVAFPYNASKYNGNGADWTKPSAHETVMKKQGSRADFLRKLDADRYHVAMNWSEGATLRETAAHHFVLSGDDKTNEIKFTAAFAQSPLPAALPNVAETVAASKTMWRDYWTKGGAIDLSESKDLRWRELERRIVLSRYLTRIQCAGSMPPQESGLTCNSWWGKFHLEMHWWHSAHFALWGDDELLARSMPYYQRILPKAKAMAQVQGYDGVRWPKCVGPSGDPAPTYLEAFLIWQQPHPIFYAELLYRVHPNDKTLARYREIVFETAKFMASYAVWDKKNQQYRIGPPLTDAAEVYWKDFRNQYNPVFETAYWRWGLEAAQRWRQRLNLPRDPKWDHVIAYLPPLTTHDGVYVSAQTAMDPFTTHGRNISHPAMLAPLGMLDGAMVDRDIMRRTLRRVEETWDWEGTWGWDFPLIAMTAARLDEGENAIAFLLKDTHKNCCLVNGHNFHRNIMSVYLSSNGGLLYATALMAAGWDGAPSGNAPGFPNNGQWKVRWEGLKRAP